MELEQLKKETIYQSFEDLGIGGSNSKSKQKLDCLNFDPRGLRILDVGCNTGYFPIRFCQAGAKHVIGIDVDRAGGAGMDVIKLAKGYSEHYGIENVEFNIASIFDELNYSPKFDAITCLSTFHYFRERQPEFFKICNKMLNKGGLIVRESGISEMFDVEQYSRGVDEEPCYFLSDSKLKSMAKEHGFECIYQGPSVDQKGDKIHRFVYHFKKTDA